MPAGGVHADVHPRVLVGAAVAADPADEARQHLSLPPERCHGGLCRRLGPNAHLGVNQVSEFQELHVVVDRLLVLQRAPDALPRRQLGDSVRHAEEEGVAALAESCDQDAVAGPGLLQGGHEHDQGVGGAGLTADLVHVVDDLLRPGPQLSGQSPVLRLEEAGEDQPVHILHGEVQLFEEAVDGLGDDLSVSLLPKPPLLPHVVEAAAGRPVVVHEVIGDGVRADELGDDIPVAHEQRCGPVAEPHLVEVGRPGLALVRRRHEDAPAAARLHAVQGSEEPRGPCLEGGGEVGRGDIVPQVEGRGQDAGILPVGKGQRGGAEVGRIDGVPILPDEAVTRRRDGHGQAVLVVVAHGPLALGHHDDGRREPAHGLKDRHPVQPQPGYVGAVRRDSDHCAPSFRI